MDWGNAIVRSKTVNEAGVVTAIEMELHLDGDFRKTKKKITWLAQPDGAHGLVDVTLLDHDYLITKKKLEENDDVKDFVTPVSEFRDEARADANVADLKKGDIIQFERKGYYIFDGVVDGRHEFIHIPDGRAASIASKAGAQQEGAGAGKKEKKAVTVKDRMDKEQRSLSGREGRKKKKERRRIVNEGLIFVSVAVAAVKDSLRKVKDG